MTLTKIDAVLPLRLRDYKRSEILRASLDRFFPDLGTCWVVTPDREFEIIRSKFAGGQYQVIPESTIIPELKFYRWFRRTPGWYLQQLVKLAITPMIDTKFYVTLDGDVICTRQATAADLLQGKQALTLRHKGHIHEEWYVWAERVLGLPRSGLVHGVTPALLNKEAVTALQDHLSHRVHFILKWLGNLVSERAILRDVLWSWRSFLLRNIPWTEYTLYYTFLEANGLFEKYHYEGERQLLCGPSVWQRKDFLLWDPKTTFNDDKNFFVVIQSYAANASEVWEKVGEFLDMRKTPSVRAQ